MALYDGRKDKSVSTYSQLNNQLPERPQSLPHAINISNAKDCELTMLLRIFCKPLLLQAKNFLPHLVQNVNDVAMA